MLYGSVALDFSYIRKGYVEEFNVGGVTRMVEVLSNKYRCRHTSLTCVDVKVTDSYEGLEDERFFTWEAIQLDSFLEDARAEQAALAG